MMWMMDDFSAPLGPGEATLWLLRCGDEGRLEGDVRRDTSRDGFLLLLDLLLGLRERRIKPLGGDLDLRRGERRGDLLGCLRSGGDLPRLSGDRILRSLVGVPDEGLLSSPGDLLIKPGLGPRSGERLRDGDG